MIDIRILIACAIVIISIYLLISQTFSIVSSNNNTYDLHVYPWGAQVVYQRYFNFTGWTG